MKKIIICVIAFTSTVCFLGQVNAQAFEKGNINLDLGLGFGLYGTALKSGGVTLDTDGASSFVMPLVFEYGISNKFGIGAQVGYSNYFIDNEDSTETTESVKSTHFAVNANFHLLNSDKNDLFIGLGVGGSSINWKFINSSDKLSGSGMYFSIYIKDRLFISEHVGILFNLGYTSYNYSNLEFSSSSASFLNDLGFTLKGVNIGTGLAVKF